MQHTFEGDHIIDGFGRVEAQVLGKLAAVLSILVDPELEVLAKCLIELLEVILVFRDL